jgi:cupin fold WbuC family metalloprotein
MRRIDRSVFDAVTTSARTSPRRRMNRNLHAMEDPIHRLLNAMEPESYVQPHRHGTPPRMETLLVVRGRGAILVFDDAGSVRERALLSPAGPDFIVELEAGTWHTLLALEPGTIWFEVKQGPYAPPPPSDVAAWAPDPGAPKAAAYLEELRSLARAP